MIATYCYLKQAWAKLSQIDPIKANYKYLKKSNLIQLEPILTNVNQFHQVSSNLK